MKVRRHRIAVVIALLLLLLAGGLLGLHPKVRWRVGLVASKLQGARPDMSWPAVARELTPWRMSSSRDAERRDPYRALHNPRTSLADIASGAAIFRSQCSSCHGPDGTGGAGPNLRDGEWRHGASDWAVFLSIARGVPGTDMEGSSLSEHSVWQVVAYLRSLTPLPDQAGLGLATSEEGLPADTLPSIPLVTYERLLRASDEPADWLTYSGTYSSHRYSRLDQINRNTVESLELKWVFQMPTNYGKVETTPLVVHDVMFLTEPPSNVVALDARTGRQLWRYERDLPDRLPLCCGRVNRGLAVLGDRLYLGALDAHLVALDTRSGAMIWDVEVADHRAGYSITAAPLAVRDKIIVGIAGGEYGIRGFLDAYDAKTGERVWRFYTVPGPGEPGHETWSGDSWKTGGAPTWLTGSFDPELNLVYWGVGNPGPDFESESRKGDNLYSNCVIALNADTGELKWYFQFTPEDIHDWDAVQIPVLADGEFLGEQRKLILWANKNAFFYVLDRESGELLLAREFARQNWADGIDSRGRPILRPGMSPSREGVLTYPGGGGATNWWSPSYSPLSGLLYVPVMEWASIFFSGESATYTAGSQFMGCCEKKLPHSQIRAAIRALAPETGAVTWEYRLPGKTPRMSGVLSTAGNLVFAGADDRGRFVALDAETGELLWQAHLGGHFVAAPITYSSQGEQQVTIAAGRAIFTFALGD